MKASIRIIAISFLVSLFPVFLLASPSLAYTWTTEDAMQVDDYPHPSHQASLALDSEGKPRVMYLDRYVNVIRVGGNWYASSIYDKLYRAYQDSTVSPYEWPYEFLGQTDVMALDSDESTFFLDIDSQGNSTAAIFLPGYLWCGPADNKYFHSTIDSSDTRHLAWCDLTGHQMQYSYYDGSDWQSQTFDTEDGYERRGIFMDTDALNNPHIAYYKNDGLHYAFYDGSDWLLETVDATAGAGAFTSLSVTDDGEAHIAYTDGSGNVMHGWRDGSGWHTELVTEGDSPDIEVNPFTGEVYISLIRSSDITLARFAGGWWNLEDITVNDDVWRGVGEVGAAPYQFYQPRSWTDLELHFEGAEVSSIGIVYMSAAGAFMNSTMLASAQIPEPGTFLLLAPALLGFAGLARRKCRSIEVSKFREAVVP